MNQETLRKRIVEEDTLLSSRTTIFLISNGFLLNALGVANNPSLKIIICLLGAVIAFIWAITSHQSWRVITALHEYYHELFPDDEINKKVFEVIKWKSTFGKTIFGPTELIALWLPLLILISWISIGLLLAIGI